MTISSALSRDLNDSYKRDRRYQHANPFAPDSLPRKRIKKTHYSAELLVEVEDRHGKVVPIRCLIDTGTSATMILRQFVRKGRAKSYKGKQEKWRTLGGTFTTNRKVLIDFSLPEFDTKKKISWICHVDEKTPYNQNNYDMIIGMDLQTELGLYVNTDTKMMVWKDTAIPLKERGDLNDPEFNNMLYHVLQEPAVLQEAETRQARILDADYSKVDIDEYVDELPHLADKQKQQLKETLNKHKQLFSGGLGTLNVRPVHLEVQKDAQPLSCENLSSSA